MIRKVAEVVLVLMYVHTTGDTANYPDSSLCRRSSITSTTGPGHPRGAQRISFRRLTLRRNRRRPETSRAVPVSSDQSYWRASGTCSRSEQRYTARPRTKPGLPKGFPPPARLRPLDLTRKALHCLLDPKDFCM